MSQPRTTDWDRYYCRPFCAARLSRGHTGRVVLRALQAHAPRPRGGGLVIAELGGADSCLYDLLCRELRPRAYHVIDQNRSGLDLLWSRRATGVETVLRQGDVLEPWPEVRADLVISVGLIEHLDPGRLAQAVAAHFRLAAPGGLVLMTFPTPTWLYRLARRAAERTGLWMFPDERPLPLVEVIPLAQAWGEVLQTGLIWPIVFTQAWVAVRFGAAATHPGGRGETSP